MKIYWNGTSKNIIGSKVKQLRTVQGLSQAALAGRLQLLGMECSDLTVIPHFIYFQIHCTSVKFNKAPVSNKLTFIASDSLIPGRCMLS